MKKKRNSIERDVARGKGGQDRIGGLAGVREVKAPRKSSTRLSSGFEHPRADAAREERREPFEDCFRQRAGAASQAGEPG
ncbi:MAG: hypothetical protein LC126_00125 [Bryobacterales bacterium]|nr:hypothetical protein [Bryobacterales bacterium]